MSTRLSNDTVERPTLAEIASLYLQDYNGRDASRHHRIGWWVARLGDRPATSLTDDDVFQGLEDLAQEPARRYAGRDIDGKKIFRARRTKRSGATVNRYHVALGALYSWAIRRRRLPKGFGNPCQGVERQREPTGRVRFLSDEERARLLEACRASKWQRLYCLVLLALTTGARRGELMALRWRDIDLERGVAYVHDSKNEDRRVLPLTRAASEELNRFQGPQGALVFASRLRTSVPFSFETAWGIARKQARLANFRFHDCRHSCASMLAQNGASLLEIADVLGHRQLAMTKRYSHLTVQSKANLVNRIMGEIR